MFLPPAGALTIRLLGQMTISLGDKPITELPTRKAEALLIYLVCQKRPYSREVLAELLWDDRPQEQALANLRSILSSLRREFAPYLLVTRQTVAFNHESTYWLDSAVFQSAITHTLKPDSPNTLETMRAALDLYQGNFLEGFYLRESRGFEEWASLERERLQRTAVSALRHLVQHHLQTGDYQTGVEYAARLLALDTLSEETHRQMMLLLARSGQRNAALAQYETCRRLLADELGVSPTSETTALYERIRSAQPAQPLPATTTPFVGREVELKEVWTHLTNSQCRLLTILGSGGMGKTRLALHTIRQITTTHPGMFLHGVWYVPLTAVENGRFLPTAIAQALNFAFHGSQDPAEQLLNYLRQKELLLLLDNYEQLLESENSGLNFLGDILRQAPLVKLFITSRERLHLYEEWVFDVPGLRYPADAQVATTVDTLQFYDAVGLFVQNARRQQQQFVADMPAIIRICQLLEGLPLGIELAATWVRQLTCAEIAHQIEQDIDFLTATWHNAPPRHRSLRAVFDHSWNLLSLDEQQLLSQLAIFRGGFVLQAAQQVTGASPRVLGVLVDKSLLRVDENGRYDMHNLLRQYAAEKLPPMLESEVEAKYGRYYAHFLHQQEAELDSPREKAALEAMHLELPNLRLAWGQATARQDAALIEQMMNSLAYLYDVQGLFPEGQELFWAAGQVFSGSVQGRLYTWAGRLAHRLGQYDKARQLLQDSVALLRPEGDSVALTIALSYLGELERYESHLPLSHTYHQESLNIARTIGHRQAITRALLHLGNIHLVQGEFAEGGQLYEEALALCQESGSRRQTATLLDNWGTVALKLGQYQAAHQRFQAAYELRLALNDKWGIATSLHNLAVLAAAAGNFSGAKQGYLAATAVFREIGYRWGVAHCLTNLGDVSLSLGEEEQTAPLLQEALGIWRELGVQIGEADVLFYLGKLALKQGQYGQARQQLEQALSLYQSFSERRLLSLVLLHLGQVAICQEDEPAAHDYLHQSLHIAQQTQTVPDTLKSLLGWADWYVWQGQPEKAVELLVLVAYHPIAQEVRREAEEKLQKVCGALPVTVAQDAVARGETLDVETAVSALLQGK